MSDSSETDWLTPLTRAEADLIAALDWTFIRAEIGIEDLTGICCLPAPFPLAPQVFPMAYQTMSSDPLRLNCGLALLAPGHRPEARLPRHLIPPEGWYVAGHSAARAPRPGPHPFAHRLPPEIRTAREAIETAILAGEPLPDAPPAILRVVLRVLASDHPDLIRPLAREADPALYESL